MSISVAHEALVICCPTCGVRFNLGILGELIIGLTTLINNAFYNKSIMIQELNMSWKCKVMERNLVVKISSELTG